MKTIKVWDWDYSSLEFGHNWCLHEDDFDGERWFKFGLFDFMISKGHIELTILNFGICYQWDDKPTIKSNKERNESWKISQSQKKKRKYQAWIDGGIDK